MDFSLSTILQAVLALGLLNVWLLRANSETSYRGGQAKSLKDEFDAYGLPIWMFYLVGALKLGVAAALLIGIWVPVVVLPAAVVLVTLMIGALILHAKLEDPTLKSLPAFVMLALAASLCAFNWS